MNVRFLAPLVLSASLITSCSLNDQSGHGILIASQQTATSPTTLNWYQPPTPPERVTTTPPDGKDYATSSTDKCQVGLEIHCWRYVCVRNKLRDQPGCVLSFDIGEIGTTYASLNADKTDFYFSYSLLYPRNPIYLRIDHQKPIRMQPIDNGAEIHLTKKLISVLENGHEALVAFTSYPEGDEVQRTVPLNDFKARFEAHKSFRPDGSLFAPFDK